MTHFHDARDTGPRIAVAVTAVAGVVAIGLHATVFGAALVLLAVAGAVATGVGPALTRRAERAEDIVVPRWTGADSRALATEQRRLLAQLDDVDQLRTAVRPRVAALVEVRLARHGVAPGSAEARTLLGEPLTAFLTGTGRTTSMSPAAFGALLARIEAL